MLFYRNRYENLFVNSLPADWLPDIVILEGMFIINTVPLRIHSKLSEYVVFLIRRYIAWYIRSGAMEIHLVFDDPSRLGEHPKCIERSRRDGNTCSTDDHDHLTFTDDMKIPKKWTEKVNCRQCK